MMQSCASAAKLRGGRPILCGGIKAMPGYGTPPPRTVIGDLSQRADRAETVMSVPSRDLPSLCGTEDDALGHHAIAREVPQGDQKLARQGHDHGFARTAGVLRAGPIPLCQGALLLEQEKAPRQLDHPPTHASVARSSEPLLPALAPAFVGRAREACVPRHGASVPQIA